MSTEQPVIARTDASISIVEANKIALLIATPLTIGMFGLFLAMWGLDRLLRGLISSPAAIVGWLVLILVSIPVHEAIHGLAWSAFGRLPLSDIKFGFDTKALAPYAHCTRPMNVTAYRLGAALPGLLLGLLPYVGGLAAGHAWLTVYGWLFSTAASGDLIVLWLLWPVPSDRLVEDHPSRAGCYVLEPPSH